MSFASYIMNGGKFVDRSIYRQEADLKKKKRDQAHQADYVKLGDLLQQKVSVGCI